MDNLDRKKEIQKKYYNSKCKNDPDYIAKRNETNALYYAEKRKDRTWLNEQNIKQQKYRKEWVKRNEQKKIQKKIDDFKKRLIN